MIPLHGASCVVITRAPVDPGVAAPEPVVAAICAALHALPFDVRKLIARPMPWIMARRLTAEDAQRQRDALRAQGLGAVTVDASDLRIAGARDAQHVAFEGDRLVINRGERAADCAAIALIFLARMTSGRERTTTEDVVVSRAREGHAITVEMTSHDDQRAHGLGAYLVLSDALGSEAPEAYRLTQEQLRAPWITARTPGERMQQWLELLLARCPGARVDRTLVDHPRRPREGRSAAPAAGVRETLLSNAAEVDLNVRALLSATLQGQR